MHRHPRTGIKLPVATAALAAALGLVGAAPAMGATVTVTGTVLSIEDNGTESNIITVKRIANDSTGHQVILVRDRQSPDAPNSGPFAQLSGNAIIPGPGCTPAGTGEKEVRCVPVRDVSDPSGDPKEFTSIVANLGNNSDYFAMATGSGDLPPITGDGEAGDDVLYGSQNNDRLSGSDGDDQLYGGAGNDTLVPGAGADDPIAGGDFQGNDAGVDTVDYGTSTLPLVLTIDGTANDGLNCVLGAINQPQNCEKDRIATTVENVIGGSNNDIIVGSAAANALTGNGGDDVLNGLGASDTLTAGEGNNTIRGLDGNDTITAGAGNDLVEAGIDNDNVNVGNGVNTVFGEQGDDTLTTGTGVDRIDGAAGNDTITAGDGEIQNLTGGTGQDTIKSGTGVDLIDGGDDNDNIAAGDGNNVVKGGLGGDTISSGTGNDDIDAGAGDDGVTAGNGNNLVEAGDGNDTVTTGTGNDVVNGRTGSDTMTLGAGNDFGYGHDGVDEINAEAGDDFLQGFQGADTLNAGDGSDTASYEEKVNPVFAQSGSGDYGEFCRTAGDTRCERDKITTVENYVGGSGDDYLLGSDTGTETNKLEGRAGNDELDGTRGNDDIRGDEGDDNLIGGIGGDRLEGGNGYDQVSYKTSPSGVTVTLDGQSGDGASGENDNVLGDVEKVEGSLHDDSLTGSNQRNDLYGLNGNDQLTGLGGPDLMRGGGNGNPNANGKIIGDSVSYIGSTSDLVITLDNQPGDGHVGGEDGAEGDDVGEDIERVSGGSGSDTIIGSQTLDTANTLFGNGGNDVLDGGLGPDELWGGEGTDTAVYNRANTETVHVTLNEQDDDGAAVGGIVTEFDNVRTDIENLKGGAEVDVFEGSPDPNVVDGGAGNDVLSGLQSDDVMLGGAGDDTIYGGAGNDRLDGGTGADVLQGQGGTDDQVDYSGRSATSGGATVVTVTFDDVANDGEQGEGDNADQSNERVLLPASQSASNPNNSGGTGGAGPSTGGTTGGTTSGGTGTTQQTGSTGAGPSTGAGSTATGASTSGVRGTTQTGSTTGTGGTATTNPKAKVRRVSLRLGKKVRRGARTYVKVTGRVLGSCAKGEKLAIKIRSGKRIVGKRSVKLDKSCKFRTRVKLTRVAKKLRGEAKLAS